MKQTRVLAAIACIAVGACTPKAPVTTTVAPAVEHAANAAPPAPVVAVSAEAMGSAPLFGGMHYRNGVIEFNPADLPGDWRESILPRLAAGTRLWVSTIDGVVEARIARSELTRTEGDPKFLSSGALKIHLEAGPQLHEEIVFVSLAPLYPKSWTVRSPSAEEDAFARNAAKARFGALTGKPYRGPVAYRESHGNTYYIDLDQRNFGAFVVETKRGDFMIAVFQLPGDSRGYVTSYQRQAARGWEEFDSFEDDFRLRLARIDVDGDGVPELLHSGPSSEGWDVTAFYPKSAPILRIRP